MSIEKNLLLSILKLTEKGPAKQELVKIDARAPSSLSSMLLLKLQNENLVYLNNGLIEANPKSRLRIAIKAIEMGANVEQVSDFLRWQEFEEMAAFALESNGYVVEKNLRFKHEGKRWEIDVVGCKKPLVVCIDCKRWHHGMHDSSLGRMVSSQSERVVAFSKSLPSNSLNLQCVKWNQARFVPVILSLIQVNSKFYDGVPIVPVLQLQDFISQMPLHVESLKYFTREFTHL